MMKVIDEILYRDMYLPDIDYDIDAKKMIRIMREVKGEIIKK
jgi:hypothetical protein